MKTFYLLDGHAQVFRAYYAPFRPLTSPSGEPVKAVHVFTQLLLNIILKEKPDYLAIAFDVADATTERANDYPEYKAQREAAPDDLAPQFQRVFEVVEALGIPVFMVDGHEADDVIATIAEHLHDEAVELRIVSKDKDLHQILTSKVQLWDPSSGALLGPAELLALKGYRPEQAVEIQTLVGDPTDNIPGVHGVGVKTAAKLIERYGTAENVLAHADEQTPKLRENLLAGAETLPLTRRLVTLKRDVPFHFDLAACLTPTPQRGRLQDLFSLLGFQSLLAMVPGGSREEPGTLFGGLAPESSDGASTASVSVPTNPHRVVHRVDTPEALAHFVKQLAPQRLFAFDTETTGLSVVDDDLVGLAFSWEVGEGWYIPVRSRVAATLTPEQVLSAVKPLLESDDVLKIGHHLKFDLSILERAGIRVKGPLFDTLIAAALLNPERRGNSMDALALDLLQMRTTPIKELIGGGREQRSMLDVPLEQLTAYAAEDAEVTLRLYQHLGAALEETDEALKRLFSELEMPLVRVLAAMERAGISLDRDRLAEYQTLLEERISGIRSAALEAAGRPFNLDSPKQVGELLFGELGFRVVKKTKTGASTDAEVLETLAAETQHPLPELLLAYRELSKLLSTYVEPLPGFVSRNTGRIHPSFHQTGAATGRLSSSNPNIQNIPIRTDAGREIRRAFVARDKDHVLITADYSQIELRVLAHFSEDAALIEAFRAGRDIHTFVASQIFGVPLEVVSSKQRSVAKTVNFGIVYGQGAFGLARTLRIPQSDAQAFITAYKATYVGLERFLQQCVAEAREHGFVRTILGRRRPIPQVQSRNGAERALGERLAINTVVQGSAADLIKRAMVRLDARLQREGLGGRMLVQVHDELVLEVRREHALVTRQAAIEEMQQAITLRVPLRVDAAMGDNWLEGKG